MWAVVVFVLVLVFLARVGLVLVFGLRCCSVLYLQVGEGVL